MPFDWRDFLLLAHELRNDRRESVRRTCLGRVYYYAYNLGLTKARQMNWPEPSSGKHSALWYWYAESFQPADMQQIGVRGSRLYSLRIEADYKDRPITDPQAVQKQLIRARELEILVAQNSGHLPPSALLP